MSAAGIADRLIAWVLALIGRLPGSLGVSTVGACTLIGAISGSSTATVAAVSRTLYPSLIREGYGVRFSSGLISSSGSIDIVIPPSIAMILYGASAEQSIPKLFAAGVLPGLLIALLMSPVRRRHGAAHGHSHDGTIRPAALSRRHPRCRPGALHAGVHPVRHLSRLVLADRSRRVRLPLRDPRRPLRLPRRCPGRTCSTPRSIRPC